MTGFAFVEKTRQDLSVSVEIKGCNSRYLEIFVNLPPWLSVLEMKVRNQISLSCGRGKIEVQIRIREYNAPIKISVNKNAAKAYFDSMNDLAKELGIDEKPKLATLLGLDGVLEMKVRNQISLSCGRGKIEVQIRIREYNA
ncbi:MAG: YicC family protein, partial [Treponema sp.]|nr:YicC family protein [Treponema sp.]